MKKLINKVVALITKSTLTKVVAVVIALAICGGVVLTVNYFNQQESDKVALAADREKEENELAILIDMSMLEVDEESNFDYSSIVVEATGTVTFPEAPLDTSVLGPVEVIYTVTSEKYEDISKEISITLTVVEIDKTPVLYGAENISVDVGSSKEKLLENVSAFDYKGNVITVDIEGSYNLSRAGTYNVKYVATDDYGNTKEIDFVLTVKSTGSGGNGGSGGSGGGNSGSGGGNGGSGGGNNNNGNNNNNNGGTTQACPNGIYPDRPCDAILESDLGDKQFYGPTGQSDCMTYGNDKISNGTQPEGATNFMCAGLTNNKGEYAGSALNWFYGN